jgi:hypothetical protein
MNADTTNLQVDRQPPRQILHWQQALLWHGLGFTVLVVLTWFDALFDLTHYLLGEEPRTRNIGEVAIKTAVIVVLWIGSGYKLYRIVSRLSYLENFLHVCSWCRKIQHQDMWLSLEEHFQRRTGGEVSHGICPDCAERFRREASKIG